MRSNPLSLLRRRACRRGLPAILLGGLLLCPSPAHASLFKGEALDTMADVLTWVVLIVAPTVGVAVFWIVHILPEKIAEKRQHPQAKAIQCLCLLSLVFGGLLWPIAWLWAYSKPVLYKLAYGTDKVAHGHEEGPSESDEAVEQKQAVAEYARMALRALGDVENTLADRDAVLTAAVADSERALELAQTSYRVGRSDLRPVQQQQLNVYAARLALLRVRSEQLAERVNLHLALGGSFAPVPDLQASSATRPSP